MKDYLLNDKKNRHGLVNFTLLDRIGHASPDHQIPVESLSALLNPIS